jgi:hypothetical protein
LGTTIDAASKVLGSPSNRTSQKWEKLRYLKFAILIGTVILALFSVNVWGYLDPLSIFNRGLTVVLYPFATLLVDRTLLAATQIPFLEDAAYFLHDPFKAFIMPETQHHQGSSILLLLTHSGPERCRDGSGAAISVRPAPGSVSCRSSECLNGLSVRPARSATSARRNAR